MALESQRISYMRSYRDVGMKGIWYSRGIVVWLILGIVLLDAYLIELLLSTPFEWEWMFLGWLCIGLHVVTGYGLINLWDTDITVL